MLDALRLETDLARIPALARQVEDRLLSLHPFLPLFSGTNVVAVRRSVVGGDVGTSAELRDLLNAAPVGSASQTGGGVEK
jgi:hypothetical protein